MLPLFFALAAVLVSCASSSQPEINYPAMKSAPATPATPAIVTTMIEVTGDTEEKLRIELNRGSGKCQRIWVNDEKKKCEEVGIDLSKTYFCTPPDNNHQANTDINNNGQIDEGDLYCGEIKFLTEGADIQYKASSVSENQKCKLVGGSWYCYP
jgi:hypothetical protein